MSFHAAVFVHGSQVLLVDLHTAAMLDEYLRTRNSGCRWHPSQSIPHRVRELGASANDETIRISKTSLECVVDAPGSDDAAWLIRRFGDGSKPLSISAQGWAAWDLPELTAPHNFTSPSDRLFATAFMFWPVGERGGPVEYPVRRCCARSRRTATASTTVQRRAAALPAAAARATARSPATASRPATRCPSCVSTRLRPRRTNGSTATWRRASPSTRRRRW